MRRGFWGWRSSGRIEVMSPEFFGDGGGLHVEGDLGAAGAPAERV